MATYSREELQKFNCPQLKDMLKARKMKQSGRKAEMIARLLGLEQDHIKWITSVARKTLLNDLSPGGILFQRDNISPQTLWEYYQNKEEFGKVQYNQFEARLKDHRRQVNEQFMRSKKEEEALDHDRKIYPRKDTNNHGELVFDMHPAKTLLRKDVEMNAHKNITSEELWRSRTEYQQFEKTTFQARIKQEVKRKKFINYLQLKQTNSEKEKRDWP